MLLLVRLCIWVLDFYNWRLFEALMASFRFALYIVGKPYYDLIFVCLTQSLKYMLWMTTFKTFSLKDEVDFHM